MTKRIFVACLAVTSFVGCHSEKSAKWPECGIIHKPASGCPTGWREEPGRFTEKDGRDVSACHAPPDSNLPPCTDYLKGGESEHYKLFVPSEPEPQPQPTIKKVQDKYEAAGPTQFQFYYPGEAKIECSHAENAPDKPWDVRKVSGCRIVGELSLDQIMNGVLEVNRNRMDLRDQCEKSFQEHLRNDVDMLDRLQKAIQVVPKSSPLKKG